MSKDSSLIESVMHVIYKEEMCLVIIITLYTRNKYSFKHNKRKFYRSVTLSYGIVLFSKSHIFVFCALNFHKNCRKQTLIDRKHLSPYPNSIVFFSQLIFCQNFVKINFFSFFSFNHLRRRILRMRHRDINKPIPMLHILISDQH